MLVLALLSSLVRAFVFMLVYVLSMLLVFALFKLVLALVLLLSLVSTFVFLLVSVSSLCIESMLQDQSRNNHVACKQFHVMSFVSFTPLVLFPFMSLIHLRWLVDFINPLTYSFTD